MVSIKNSTLLITFVLLSVFYSATSDPQNAQGRPENPNNQPRPANEHSANQNGSHENDEREEDDDRARSGEHGGNYDWDRLERGIYEKCSNKNISGQCYGSSPKCVEENDCKYMVLIEKDSRMQKYNFTVFSSEGERKNDAYVAVGLSLERDMKDASIVACIAKGNNNIATFWSAKTEPPKKVNAPYIHPINVKYGDNKIWCHFQRDASSTIDNKHIFKLDENKYRILLAVGETKEDPQKGTKLEYHKKDTDKTISELLYLSNKHRRSSSSRHYASMITLVAMFSLVF